ncbi:MAG: GyrI-like domain-containing protein [Ginsengibacter sp.]
MKKVFLFLLVVLAVATLAVYVFIPADIKFSSVVFIKTKAPVLLRTLSSQSGWIASFAKQKSPDTNYTDKIHFDYKNDTYTIKKVLMNTAEVNISNDDRIVNTLINAIPINNDSVAVEWAGDMHAGNNLISRIKYYSQAKSLKGKMENIMESLKAYLEENGMAYGLEIKEQQVVDTVLISTKHNYKTFPTTNEIYGLIDNLKKYILQQGAKETNPPMLNIKNDSGYYKTMVAIPVDRELRETENFAFKRMVPGKILVAEIRGGYNTAIQALKQMDLYLSDNHLSAPAIPFQSLVTDRSVEPDSTKWVTKIYYPIY